MAPNEAKYPVGTDVRIADLEELARFQASWKSHNPLQPEQLEYAGAVAIVRELTFYRDRDPLYVLQDVPGVWHEACLRPA